MIGLVIPYDPRLALVRTHLQTEGASCEVMNVCGATGVPLVMKRDRVIGPAGQGSGLMVACGVQRVVGYPAVREAAGVCR